MTIFEFLFLVLVISMPQLVAIFLLLVTQDNKNHWFQKCIARITNTISRR